MIDGLINTFGIETFSMYKIILQNNFTYTIFLNILQIFIYEYYNLNFAMERK